MVCYGNHEHMHYPHVLLQNLCCCFFSLSFLHEGGTSNHQNASVMYFRKYEGISITSQCING